MGSAYSCDQCPSAVTSSVINLSDGLVTRMTEGHELEENPEDKIVSLEDHEWFEKLKCIDNAHTAAYGLSMENFFKMSRKIEVKLEEMNVVQPCSREEVLECYKSNSTSALNCTRQIEEFIDCVDMARFKTLKQRVDEDATLEQKKSGKLK